MKKIKLLVTSVILGTSLLFSSNVFAKDNINVKRLAGQDRYETCSKIVQDGWTTSNYAIICNGENFPDALSAAPLAKKYNAPILLTESDKLNENTQQKLKDLGVKNVFIIGGTGVINSNVENTLKSMGISTKRIYGQDRFETSSNVSKELGEKGVFVVSGETYEDALSVAPIASQLGYSIVLVEKNRITGTVLGRVVNTEDNNGEVIVIGGTDVISDNISNLIKPSKRYSQSTKYERNLAIINDYKDKLDLSKLYVASDKGFADALSGSALAGLNNNPIILVGSSNQDSVGNFVKNNEKIKDINVIGGTGVVSEDIVSRVINSNVNSNNATYSNNGNTTISGNNNVVNNGTINNITNIINSGNGNSNTSTPANNTNNNSQNQDYIIKAGSTQINLEDYKDYIRDYKDKVKTLIQKINPNGISVKTSDNGDFIVIFLDKNNSIGDILENPRIGLIFYKDEKMGVSFLNFPAIADYKNVLEAVKEYLPEQAKIAFLTDFMSVSKIFIYISETYATEIKTDMVNQSNDQIYSKNFMSTYGGYSATFQIQNGKEQQIFNTVMLSR